MSRLMKQNQPLSVANSVPQGSILFNIYVYDMNTKIDAACHQYVEVNRVNKPIGIQSKFFLKF